MAKKSKTKPETIDMETSEAAPPWEDGSEQPPSSVELEVENIEAPDDNLEIIGKNQEYSLTMYLDPNTDPKVFIRFIKKVERLVRGNPDYKDYIENLRDEEGLDTCAYFGKVDVNKAEIHLHHCISNLYTICITVCSRLMAEGKRVSSFILADEVVKLHLSNKIGLVPLTATMHELAHAGKIKIPRSVVFGDYEAYYEQHKEYMDEYELKLYEDLKTFEHIQRNDLPLLTNQTATPKKEIEEEEE
jgi:hypothetical protein